MKLRDGHDQFGLIVCLAVACGIVAIECSRRQQQGAASTATAPAQPPSPWNATAPAINANLDPLRAGW